MIVIDGSVRHGIAGGGVFISLKLHAILTFPLIRLPQTPLGETIVSALFFIIIFSDWFYGPEKN